MVKPQGRVMTVEEYLAHEETSELRHDFLGGTLYAHAGGSSRHNRISLNIASHFLDLAPKGCRVYQEGMKLRVGEGSFIIPT